MTTVNDFIKELSALKPELRDKPLKVLAPNGEYLIPNIKFELVNTSNLNLTNENVSSVMLICQG